MALITQKTAGSAQTAIAFITIGALIDVWTAVYYVFWRSSDAAVNSSQDFWIVGLFLTGLTLLIIGLAIGRIGREARHADVPPADIVQTAREQPAAVNPAAVPTAEVAPVARQPVHGVVAPVAAQPAQTVPRA